jgi:hypothetical protein
MRKADRAFLMNKVCLRELRVGRVTVALVIGLICRFSFEDSAAWADSTYVYAVQLSASIQANPPQLQLNWEPDPYGATNYTVYRKAKEDTTWGTPIASLPGYATSFTDSAVSPGVAYEYQVTKAGVVGYKGYGYIYAGIEMPAIENRGTLVLVTASETAAGLSTGLDRLQSDLVGDGWQVIRHDVSSNDTPQNVRALIQADYAADPAHVNAVFLFGHVPILQSGYINYDGHGARPMPADAFYGEMNNDWPVDPASSPSYLPSDVALMVGRVDLANMPGVGSASPWPSEVELLRNYLNKDHNWRTGLMNVPRRALMGNRRGDEGGIASAASGYRAFKPLLGAGNTVEADIDDVAPWNQRWSWLLATSGPYLWAYGCGGGQDTALGYLGTHDTDHEAWSTDLVDWKAQAVFVMMFGSHLGNWDHPDNIMRAVLATPQTGLACCMSGQPHWFLHHMALGEPIGYGTRLSMNNSTLYRNQINLFPRAVYIALMGDPTLGLEPLAPAANLTATQDLAGVHLNWTGPAADIAGYVLYRSESSGGPFMRLNESMISDTNFTDLTAATGTYTYMVRTMALQTNPSGSYFNLGQGIFTTLTVPDRTGPIQLQISQTTNQVVLSWASQAGTFYHVENLQDLNLGEWQNVSGTVQASGPTCSWSGPTTNSFRGFYRVVSP